METTTLMVIALVLAISMQGAIGNSFDCQDLDMDTCAYAVESSGKRCVLEKSKFSVISNEYTCATSEIVADKLRGLIESEECISACGIDRKNLGISSDSLLDRGFIGMLCSQECYHSCPNIIDLYFNLAAAEGMYLPKLCEAQESNGRRVLINLLNSSGGFDDEQSVTASAVAPAATPAV